MGFFEELFGGGDPEPLLVPGQEQAMNQLLRYAQGGQQPYTGDFGVTPDILAQLGEQMESGMGLGLRENEMNLLNQLLTTGLPTDASASYGKQREAASTSAQRAANEVLAQAAGRGGRWSTPALNQATEAASRVQTEADAAILQQEAQLQEAATQRRQAALSGILGLRQAVQKNLLDLGRIQMAAKQFEKGMEYEEFKREYPDVYNILAQIWGRNVDFMEAEPGLMGGLIGLASNYIRYLGMK